MDMDTSFSPTILVTGAAGFIASHVVEHFAKKYGATYRIIALDKLDYCASLNNLGDADNVLFVKGDIQSIDLVSYLLQTYKVDIVMHFAAQTHVDNSFGDSLSFTLNNAYGTHVLLEACRKYGLLRLFINVSTDEVYGDTSASIGSSQLAEHQALLEPTNPYSAAKAAAEMICQAYLRSYKVPIIITRGNNVYGPRQFPEKLIPKFSLLCMKNRPLPVHGNGSALRSYLHVDDVAEAFDVIMHKGAIGEIYNIGTDDERTVLSVAHDIARMVTHNSLRVSRDIAANVEYVQDRAFNDTRYYIDNKKLVALGWSPKKEWEEGLRETIQWYKGLLDTGALDTYWPALEGSRDMDIFLQPHPKVFSRT